MTVQLPLYEGALSVEQWQLLEGLAKTLTPTQARWISGYLAGFDAGLLRGSDGEIAPVVAPQGRNLTILYGTETGNSRELARALATASVKLGLAPKLADLADYKVRNLKDEQDILFIVSTYGEGDPPQPSVSFFEFLEGRRAPRLDGVRFSVLALGDSTYEKYCEAGKRIDRRLEELGASRLSPRVDCDIDNEEQSAECSGALLRLLASQVTASAAVSSVPTPARAAQQASVHNKRHPFVATVLENIRIVGRTSTKETRHIELDLSGSGLSYEPGDSLGIAPCNEARVVEELLDATSLSGEEEVTLKNSPVTLASALTNHFEIAIASPRFINQWPKLSGASELEPLRGGDAARDRVRFLTSHHVIDVVKRFPVSGIDAGGLCAGLRSLQPRLYSLASSPTIVCLAAHITVAPVRYELHGTPRSRVASTQIADRLRLGSTIPVYVQENVHFRLPPDNVPIIMIGPGTGVAPFRAFLQEREARAAAGRAWLFFGERNLRSDFLYQIEWQQWLKDGVLTRLDVAFSREPSGKSYVQHRMMERPQKIYAWLEEGAHFYVCGDEKAMARDVHETLIEIIERSSGQTRAHAQDYVRRLAADHRYQRDVY